MEKRCADNFFGLYLIKKTIQVPALLPLTYPLELILQNTGDVKAEIGAECQQAVEEEHHKAIVSCENKIKNGVFLELLSETNFTLIFHIYYMKR